VTGYGNAPVSLHSVDDFGCGGEDSAANTRILRF